MTTPIFRERMSLLSIAAKFNPDINPLDPAESALSNLEIAWSNDVLRDEVVISSVPHRRALMNFEFGDLPQEIGMTLSQLFGAAAVDQVTLLTSANAGLVAANTAAAQEIAELNGANSALANELADKQQALDQAQTQLLAAVGEVTRLGAALEQANAIIAALQAGKAAQAAAATTAEAPSDEPA